MTPPMSQVVSQASDALTDQQRAWLPLPAPPVVPMIFTDEEVDLLASCALFRGIRTFQAAEDLLPADRRFAAPDLVAILKRIEWADDPDNAPELSEIEERCRDGLKMLWPFAPDPGLPSDQRCLACRGFGMLRMHLASFSLKWHYIHCFECSGTGMSTAHEDDHRLSPERELVSDARWFAQDLGNRAANEISVGRSDFDYAARSFYSALHACYPDIGADEVLRHQDSLMHTLEKAAADAYEVLDACCGHKADRWTRQAAQDYYDDCVERQKTAKRLFCMRALDGLGCHLSEIGAADKDSYRNHEVSRRLGGDPLDVFSLAGEAEFHFSKLAARVAVDHYFYLMPPEDYDER